MKINEFFRIILFVGVIGTFNGCISHQEILVDVDSASLPATKINHRVGVYIKPTTKNMVLAPTAVIRVYVGKGFVNYTKKVLNGIYQSVVFVDKLNLNSPETDIDMWILVELTDIKMVPPSTCMIKSQWKALDKSGKILWKETYASMGEIGFFKTSYTTKCFTDVMHNHFLELPNKLRSASLP